MAEFTVYFSKVTEISVKVEADDYETAIELGYDAIPELSAQATGWGQSWSRDESGEAEPESVATADGEFVWTTNEHWTRTHVTGPR